MHRFVALAVAFCAASAALVAGARAPLASAIAAESGARLLADLKAAGTCGAGGIDLSSLTHTAGAAADYSYSDKSGQNTWFVTWDIASALFFHS